MAILGVTQAAKLIETYSAQLCREHYEMGPHDEWFHGGPDHNDDRLTATVQDDDSIEVSDGNTTQIYAGPTEDSPLRAMHDTAIRAYVSEWLADVWA
jgi:hypothetical protein